MQFKISEASFISFFHENPLSSNSEILNLVIFTSKYIQNSITFHHIQLTILLLATFILAWTFAIVF